MSNLPRIEETIKKKIDAACITDNSVVNLHEILFDKDVTSKHGLHIKNVTFTKCLFTHKFIKSAIFQNCTFEYCQFNGVHIESCEFHQCKFVESCFFKARISDTYLDPTSFYFSRKWYIKWANVNAWWYQALYRNSMDIHQEHFAMIADRHFQFYRRYEYLFGKHKRPFSFIQALLYDITLGYGYGILSLVQREMSLNKRGDSNGK